MTRQECVKEMVAAFRQDCKEILDTVLSAEAGEVLSPEVEFEIRRKALRRYAQALQEAVKLRGKQERRKSAPECSCGEKMRMIRQMPRTVMSLLGELRFTRRHYYCDRCRKSRWPFDEEMGIGGGWTEGAVRLMTRAGATESFEEARKSLKELAEMQVSGDTIRTVTEGIARDIEAEQEAGRLQGEESPASFEREDWAYVTMDATSVNTLDGWRQIKLGALYDQPKAKQHYAATLDEAAAFGSMVRGHAMGLRFGRAAKKFAGGDGAEWIWNQMRINFPTVNEEFLDFYHLGENIYKAAWRLYGESSPAGRRWARANLHLAKEQGGERLKQALERGRRRQKKRTAKKAIDDLLRYVQANQSRTAYPRLREQGIDIGTGPQESACKNVIGRRLKGSGMRWSAPNAEAMGRLRALMCSTGSWDAFWAARQSRRRVG
jgi:hypothetical protein